MRVHIGIDLGSTTTKAVMLDEDGALLGRGITNSRSNYDLAASIARPNPGQAYNLCDEEAAPPQDVIAYASDLLGVDAPPEISFDTAELSPMAQSFYRDNKRVSNSRIKEELGVRLAWPTYREGLRGLLE